MKLVVLACCLFWGFVAPAPDVRSWSDSSSMRGEQYTQFSAKELCAERVHFECKLGFEGPEKRFREAYSIAYSTPFCWTDRDSGGRYWWSCTLTCSAFCYTRIPENEN